MYSFADNTGTANDIYLQYTYNEFNMLKAVDIYDNGDDAFRPSATYEYDNGDENMGRQTKETIYYKHNGVYSVYNYTKQAYFLSGEQFYNANYDKDNVMAGRDLYYYNVDGKRVRKGNDIAGTNYFYSGGAVLYTTRNDIGTLLTENIVTPGGNIVCSKRFEPVEFADKWYTYNYDNRGSVSAILSPDGTLTKEYIYDSFGIATSGGSDTFSTEFQFTGAVADGDGVYYMNSRYYNSNTGRFLTQDTYSGNAYEPWTQHLYTYCGNNPVNMVDPTGHYTQQVPGGYIETMTGQFYPQAINGGGGVPNCPSVGGEAQSGVKSSSFADRLFGAWLYGTFMYNTPMDREMRARAKFQERVQNCIDKGIEAVKKDGISPDDPKFIERYRMYVGFAMGMAKANDDAFQLVSGLYMGPTGDLLKVESGLFRNFEVHYNKHVVFNGEFGNISREAYFTGALDLATLTVDGTNILSRNLSKGRMAVYNVNTNELVIIHDGAQIGTYFKPDTGLKYFIDTLN